jgi:hypothetical protein
MKVSELIELLKQYPEDHEVVIASIIREVPRYTIQMFPIEYLPKWSRGDLSDESNAVLVFSANPRNTDQRVLLSPRIWCEMERLIKLNLEKETKK